ncbi:mycofactocin system GMC family oxidoreductase MftG [Oceanobacillus arenosus]|uniref:Mycofactocin system GMC family oxidoreductase MftG n=1 Tax=Oceanobacillus arenosus TaxID=1229153 RepID=A0A3D8PNW2_9BACI|nr:mycofactocin system GMC family oxidoreductase MftG [Oceanobacillus arenosus]RDW17342.1 mycofactocin system GMC family oxidoreductase MftG [Oceanobacillus arenosus]
MMEKFNVIVIGSGSAGGTLAARLSEDADRRVLLIEAGPDYPDSEDFPQDLLNASAMSGAVPGHPNNWGYVGNLTPELPYSVARGKILGGSSSLNGCYFIRGTKADFDRWVEAGNTEWSYDKVLPYYKKLENDLNFGETEHHSGEGPVPIYRELEKPYSVTKAFYQACEELGFVWEEDKNAGGEPGYGPVPLNAVDGMRINTGLAYINPIRNRSNLVVSGETLALRIIFNGKQAIGVEVERKGSKEIIYGDEIVLSAGAFNSPHLLMLSGIGSKEELEAAGVEVLHHLPGVGKGFTDHPDVQLGYKPKQALGPDEQRDNLQAVLNFTSLGSEHPGDLEIMPMYKAFGEAMLGGSGSKFKGVTDIIRRPNQTLKSMKGISKRRFIQQALHQGDLFIVVGLQYSKGRGDITLTSSDPKVQPKIDYNYLENEYDLSRLREGMRLTVEILKSEAFKPYFKKLTEIDDATLNDDDKLNAWMRSHLATAIHASGSAKMGPSDDPNAVVDQYGKVHGINGLWVADTSIFPQVPSRGPAATAIMVGERIADFIKESSKEESEITID